MLRAGSIVVKSAAILTDSRIEAPGQIAQHYAPSKPLRLNAHSAHADEWMIGYGPIVGHATLTASGDIVEAAANLFDRLHQADAQELPRIAIARIPEGGIGAAISDRLRRAAA